MSVHRAGLAGSRVAQAACRANGRNHGFTVIELMVTVTILAIIVGIGAPAMRDFVIRGRLQSQASDLTSDMQFARSEANRRQQRVVICQSDATSTGCGATNWNAGWVVFVDANRNNVFDSGVTGEEILRVHQSVPTNVSVATAPSAVAIYYRPTGPADAARVFTICQSKYVGRDVSVSITGRTSVAPTAAICP